MKPFETLVDCRKVSILRSGRVLLKEVDFNLVEGEFCYIIGPTGAGKSTFINALYGLLPIHEGQAIVLDQNLRKLTPRSMPFYRRKLGIIFQEPNLIPDQTVHQNLDFILKSVDWKSARERSDRIHKVLNDLQMSEFHDVPVTRLSTGEKQMVCLARAVLNRPRIILADEPTGTLDSDSSRLLMSALQNLARQDKTSIILATHDEHLYNQFPARCVRCLNGTFI